MTSNPRRLKKPGLLFWLVSFCCCLFLVLPLHAPLHALTPSSDLIIEINGRRAWFTDAHPFIDQNNRTMVPVRFVSEEIGASVDWDAPTQTVTIARHSTVIQLKVGSSRINVNGEDFWMDTQAILDPRTHRTYVPLRFVSEGLGAEVEAVSLPQGLGVQITTPRHKPAGLFGVAVGDSSQILREHLGNPMREEPTPYGYAWWIYRPQGPSEYLLVGVQDEQVVTLYSPTAGWDYQGVQVGTGRSAARALLDYQEVVTFRSSTATYTVHQTHQDPYLVRDLFLLEDHTFLELYYDLPNGMTVSAARFRDLPLLPKTSSHQISWTFPSGHPPDHDLPLLSDASQAAVDRGNERILFDLVNISRGQSGVPLLQWHDQAARIAYWHSADMEKNRFFDHISPVTGSLADRAAAANLQYRLLLENIASGQLDSIDAHEGLMNSPGHRENILNPQVSALGVGVSGRYYTENFLAP